MAVIQRVDKTLTDGSEVFDIRLWSDKNATPIEFHAVSEANREMLIEALKVAIENHTVETVDESFDTAFA